MRLFILGAGFSKPAGLPLGNELFGEVWRLAEIRHLTEGKLGIDLKLYIRFIGKTTGRQPQMSEINLEDFISYLDVQHILRLKGTDHWSDEGNESQIMLRNLIALALKLKQDHGERPDLKIYDDFVKQLKEYDAVETFNYNTLLEEAMERNGVAFRLAPWYQSISSDDPPHETEIEVLKLHGSIDWFDISHYEQQESKWHPVFGDDRHYVFSSLANDPIPDDNPLSKLRRLRSMWEYLGADNFVWEGSIIVAPSTHKLGYIHRLSWLWRELTNAGYYANSVSIIGFSLASHDRYLTQVIYDIVDKFQNRKGERHGPKTKQK